MKLISNKSKWQVVGDGGHVYGEFKTKRDAIRRLFCILKDLNLCRSPRHRQTRDQIWQEVLKKAKACVE